MRKYFQGLFIEKHKRDGFLGQNVSMVRYASFGLAALFFLMFMVAFQRFQTLPTVYLLISVGMLIIGLLSVLITEEHFERRVLKWLIRLYPMLIVSIAAVNVYFGQDYITERLLFYVVVFTVSFISISSYRYVFLLYFYAVALVIITILFKHGFDSDLLFAMVLFLLFGAVINLFFNTLYLRMFRANDKLNKGVYELEYTKNIAHMMMGVTSDILQNEDIDSLLNVIISKAVEVIPKATAGTILLKQGDEMRYAAAYGYDKARLSQIRLRFTDTFQYQTGSFTKPEIIQDTESFNSLKASPEFIRQLVEHKIPHSQSVITCPIIIDNEIYGSINLDNLEEEKAFKETEKPIVQYLAEQISLALKNKQLLSKTLYYTKHDMLTDAYTRIYHEELLTKVYEEAKTTHRPFCLAIIDINNMKYINDTWGHQAGDKVLIHFSQQTQKQLKEKTHLSRFGGDEFAIIFEASNESLAQKAIDDLQRHFEKSKVEINNQRVGIRFGVGIACYPVDGENLSTLISVADKRMYDNKEKVKSLPAME